MTVTGYLIPEMPVFIELVKAVKRNTSNNRSSYQEAWKNDRILFHMLLPQ